MNNALFGHRLRTYRKEKGLTIEKLAEQVGLSPNYLGDVERGKKLPSMATFIRLVNVLDISADELLKDEVNRARLSGGRRDQQPAGRPDAAQADGGT